MREIAEYLLENYYPYYKGDRDDVVPDYETLVKGLENHKEKVIVIRKDGIKGVAIYLTLCDATYDILPSIDISNHATVIELLKETGSNVHFVLLAADGATTIMMGIEEVKRRCNPSTISWFDPDLQRLNRYKVRK